MSLIRRFRISSLRPPLAKSVATTSGIATASPAIPAQFAGRNPNLGMIAAPRVAGPR
jgi:hypothetical protein